MAGLLTHLIISLAGFLIALFMFKEWKYGVAFVLGHLSPDLIDFGIIGIKIGSLNPSVIMNDSWFYPLVLFGHTLSHWIIFGIIVIIVLICLYKFNKIEKKTFMKLILILVFLLIGVGMHLVIDVLIIEHTYWM
jgi:hypothetical protein